MKAIFNKKYMNYYYFIIIMSFELHSNFYIMIMSY